MTGRCSRAVSLVADYINRTPEAKEFVADWNSTIQFDLGGEEPFALFFSSGRADVREGKQAEPDVTLYCKSELFFDILTGRIDQDEAFSNGLVEVKGSIIDSVRFRHAAELAQMKHSTMFSLLKALSRFS
jgi:putative sterol carrier protein